MFSSYSHIGLTIAACDDLRNDYDRSLQRAEVALMILESIFNRTVLFDIHDDSLCSTYVSLLNKARLGMFKQSSYQNKSSFFNGDDFSNRMIDYKHHPKRYSDPSFRTSLIRDLDDLDHLLCELDKHSSLSSPSTSVESLSDSSVCYEGKVELKVEKHFECDESHCFIS